MPAATLLSPVAARRRKIRLAAVSVTVLAALLIVALVVADTLGLMHVSPPSGPILARMQRAADGLQSYESSMMVFGGVGSPGDTCEQWRNRQGEVVTLVKTMLGYKYVERWQGDTWEFYHPGLGLQGKVTVRNSSRLVCPHWLISGYPTVQELVTAVRTARHITVEGSGEDSGQEVSVLRCSPTLFGNGDVPVAGATTLMKSEWRVMVQKSNDLPAKVMPATPGGGMDGISLSSVRPSAPPTGKDWRLLAGDVNVRRTKTLECDAASPASVRKVTQAIRSEFTAYLRTQYPTANAPAGP